MLIKKLALERSQNNLAQLCALVHGMDCEYGIQRQSMLSLLQSLNNDFDILSETIELASLKD